MPARPQLGLRPQRYLGGPRLPGRLPAHPVSRLSRNKQIAILPVIPKRLSFRSAGLSREESAVWLLAASSTPIKLASERQGKCFCANCTTSHRQYQLPESLEAVPTGT